MGKEIYLKKLFQTYYKSEAPRFPSYSDLPQREFGFIQWDQPGMTRHKAFSTLPNLTQFLERNGPRHTYVSTTGYAHPDYQDMNDKGYQFCDFVIDIDMDHFHTPCKAEHDAWTCNACHQEGKGEKPEKCPQCGGVKFQEFNWLCEICLTAAKKEFLKATSLLEHDFGIPPEEMKYFFSGNRGYHAHVENSRFRQLDGESRRELTDYVTTVGLSLDALGLRLMSRKIIGFSKDTPGWAGRIAQFIGDFLATVKTEDLVKNVGLKPNQARAIMDNNKEIQERFRNNETNWTIKGTSIDTWKALCDYAVKNIFPNIDIPVSLDVHRLIRLPDSLHGKTGFRVMQIPIDKIQEFDPFRDALVFGSQPLKVKMKGCPKFRIGDIMYGPYTAGEIVEVPATAGIFALCQGVADFP